MTQQPADPIVPPLDAAPPSQPGDAEAVRHRASLPIDLISAYTLTAARVAAWAGVSALIFRGSRPGDFGLLVLLRGTITLVGYTSIGLGPAMVRMLAAASRHVEPGQPKPVPTAAMPVAATAAAGGRVDVTSAVAPAPQPVKLDYQSPPRPDGPVRPRPTPEQRVFASGGCLGLLLAVVAAVATGVYSDHVYRIHVLPPADWSAAMGLVLTLGFGTAMRIASEPASAALQARGRLAVDNGLSAATELAWLAAVAAGYPLVDLADVGGWYLVTSVGLLFARLLAAAVLTPHARTPFSAAGLRPMGTILTFGGGVLVAQLADFLYAPAAYVVINRLLSPADLIAYAPAVQIDGALLLLVGGLAAALFPRAAAAHAAGDVAAVRRYYLLGTLAGAAVLAAAAAATALLAERLLVAWLGQDLPATRAILPLVLVHTVVGGSAAVGRSVLLGMGRVRALTVSALVAGVLNVVLGIALAVGFGWGLRGIVVGTVVVVVARAGVWMPWYVLRAVRRESSHRDRNTVL